MPSLEQLAEALDLRIEMGDLTHLVSERVSNPVAYIGQIAAAIAEQDSFVLTIDNERRGE